MMKVIQTVQIILLIVLPKKSVSVNLELMMVTDNAMDQCFTQDLNLDGF